MKISYSCVLVPVLALLASACGPDSGDCDTAIAAPKLKNLGLSIQTWDGNEGSTAGAFTFEFDNPDAPFTPFATVDAGKTFPNIEFKPRLGADILSPIDGIVTGVTEQEAGNYEIHLKTEEESCYLVSLDHVSNVTVVEGDTVTAGQVLGNPGAWSAYAGQFELQINDDKDGGYRCPVDLLDSSVSTAVEASVNQLVVDWEAMKGDSGIFDEGSMVIPGCLAESLSD